MHITAAALALLIDALSGEPRALVAFDYQLGAAPLAPAAALYWSIHPGFRHPRAGLLPTNGLQLNQEKPQ